VSTAKRRERRWRLFSTFPELFLCQARLKIAHPFPEKAINGDQLFSFTILKSLHIGLNLN